MPGLEGTSLGRYRLKRRLGKGGMAEVYLAFDERMQREVAIKVVGSNNAEFAERFSREAKAMGKLHHDHILPAYDSGEQDPWNYLVMPYVAHGTLKDLLEKGPLSLKHAGELLQQIASGLQYAHQQGFLHRDIKPSNILLRDDHYAYLGDFGLAREQERASDLTQIGTILGTPEYMAPELADGPATVSSDVYALAVVLYSMLSGRVPFRGETAISVFWKQVREYPAPPSRFNAGLPKAVDQVLMHALEKDPSRRYATPLALSQAYQAAISELEDMPDLYETAAIKEKPDLPANSVKHAGTLAQPEAPRRVTQPPPPKPRNPSPPLKSIPAPIQGFDRTTDAFVPATAPTTLIKPQRRQRRSRRFLGGIFIGLAFLFAASGVVAFLTIKGAQQNAINNTATAQTNATGAVNATQTGQVLATQQAANAIAATATASAHGTAVAAIATANAASASATASARATAQAQATQTAIAATATAITSGQPLNDPLTGPDSNNWPVDGKNCQFLNNGYVATVSGPNNMQTCISNSLQRGDVAIEVNATLVSGDSAGIAFRANASETQYYDFEITSNGHFFLRYISNSQNNTTTTILIPDTANSAIRTKGNSNTLLVIANGNDFKLFVNGTFVGEAHDSSRASGGLGVVASTSSSDGSEAIFDTLNIYQA